jgi:hypothetical protein
MVVGLLHFNRSHQTLTNHDKRLDCIEQNLKYLKEGQEILQKNILKSLGNFTEKIVEKVDNKSETFSFLKNECR